MHAMFVNPTETGLFEASEDWGGGQSDPRLKSYILGVIQSLFSVYKDIKTYWRKTRWKFLILGIGGGGGGTPPDRREYDVMNFERP